MNLFNLTLIALACATSSTATAAESVRSTGGSKTVSNSSVKPVGDVSVFDEIQRFLDKEPLLRDFVSKKALPEFEKGSCTNLWKLEKAPELKQKINRKFSCSNLLNLEDFKQRNNNFTSLCKAACMSNTAGTKAPGKEAAQAALKICLAESCEKTCEIEAIKADTSVDQYLKGRVHGEMLIMN